ncbi:MAG: ATP-binding protein [Microbacterium sp.]
MTLPQIALISLAVGLAIGVALSLVVVWAYRARARMDEETSTTVPDGVTAVLGSMDDAACVVDPSGTVLAASLAAARFGIDVGATLENSELRQLMRRARAHGGTVTESLRITRGGLGLDPRLVSVRASVISLRMTLLIIRDVTEQERLDHMRRDFVANTSHELKTPVGAVTLLAEAIESAADDPDQVRLFAARISAEAARLGQLTGRIMSLSRLQADDGLGEVRPVSIDEVIAASVEAHSVQADSAGVELVRGGDRGAWVCGDAQILIEAVGNLIANAIVYSPQGSRVGIGVRADSEAVEIAVSDQGIGIAEADRERVFERFYRADEARSRRTGGTGLGLSIVKHATQRHGGEVKLWSRPGRGSTFTIRLPRIDSPIERERTKQKKRKKKRAQKSAAPAAARVRNGETAWPASFLSKTNPTSPTRWLSCCAAKASRSRSPKTDRGLSRHSRRTGPISCCSI